MKKWPWFLLSIFIILIDQLSKYWASIALLPYEPIRLMPMLNLTLAYNSGAAFSFLHDAGSWHRWLFAGFSTFMTVVLIIMIIRTINTMKLQLWALSLILGGAIGNLIDRAFVGFVIDFIDVYYKSYHWPIFNVADSSICIGAFLVLCAYRRT